MNIIRRDFAALIATFLAALPAAAQVPDMLKHSIPAPFGTAQSGAQLGYSVAVDGGLTVVGAPTDDSRGIESGVVKIFDTATGALLHLLANPDPGASEKFGSSVAISGTRVVVGTPCDNTGARCAGSAYVYDISSGTPTVPVARLNNPSPALNDLFGNSVAISGTRVVVGASRDDTGEPDAGSAYVYDLGSATPAVPIATLNNPGPAASDSFGNSVAISGMHVVVGAFQDDTGATDAGSAYLYDLGSAIPTVPVATLNNPDPAAGDQFGISVAVSGTRVVVGAPGDDTGATDAGSVYVYDLDSATLAVPAVTLNNPGPDAGDQFGVAVAISGTRVLVGADFDDTGATDAGGAYVFDLSGAMPAVPVATLNNLGPATQDYFGFSVAISSTQIVVGARLDDMGAIDAGSAYVYELGSATPAAPAATLNNPGPSSWDFFGGSVAISGTRVVVGAVFDDTGASNAGSVYVYDLGTATPTVPVITLNNPVPSQSGGFGNSVAISGTRVVVGTPCDNTGATCAGSAYLYDISSGTPTLPEATLNNPNPAFYDLFANSVAISGTRVVVGATGYITDDDDDARRRAYVYDLSSATPTVPAATLNNPAPEARGAFGYSVAISGTLVVVAAPYETGSGNAGNVYVYDLSSGTPTVPVATLNNPGPSAGERFGYPVAISGTRVVVGAAANDAGSAYVYDMSSATPTAPVAALNNPAMAANDGFGSSVAISGTRVVVGAYANDTGAINAGSAYVYELSSATPTVPVATLNNPGPAESDMFGNPVAIDGTTVAIGTPYDDSVLADKGFAYIYGPASPPTDGDGDGLLDSWELTYWPTTSGHSPLDDFDHDGHPELLELAFGLDPALPNPGGLPPITNGGGYLTMTIAKHPGVTYEVQSAGTLLAGEPNSFSAATTTMLLDDATTLKVRDNVLTGTLPRRFLRVKVTAAP